jgi:glutathione S-transferase
MNYVELIAVLAVLQFLAFGALTGAARRKSGLKAPAIVGHEGFERMYRVQMNTLELLIAFLPALFVAARHWSPLLIAAVGAVYLIGRFVYWRAYVSNPTKRGPGFMLSMIPTMLLALMALVGVILSLAGRGSP